MTRNHAGFSLIELMVVVAIIGTLATIAIPNYVSMQQKARDASVKQVAHAVQMATEDYAVTNGGNRPADGTVFVAAMFPQSVFPKNPFTGAPIVIGGLNAYSRGDIGYGLVLATGIYTIQGFGHSPTAGPAGDGVVITLWNG